MSNLRFERKFKISGIHFRQVEMLVHQHPAGFVRHFEDRKVNNIYFDTPELRTFHENVAGINRRSKYRIRWYGDHGNKIKKCKLEIKYKRNELGGKKSLLASPFSLKNMHAPTKEVNELLANEYVLYPVLMNTYIRSYYISPNHLFRLTIDRKMRYFSLLGSSFFSVYTIEDPDIIIEVKYDQQQDDSAAVILQGLPFRHTKSSKYVTGVELTV